MLTCPRCGNDAEYLADDLFSLLRCEFCDDLIDATDEALADAVARMARATMPSRELDHA